MTKYKTKEQPLLQIYNDMLPPNDRDVEELILGSILVDGEAIFKVGSKLNVQLFFFDETQKVVECIIDLHNKNNPIDIMTVFQKSIELGYGKVATASYISSLTNRISSTANIDFHFKFLQEYALKRLMIQTCSKGIRNSYDSQVDVFDLVGGIQNDTENALKGVLTYEIDKVGDIHNGIIEKSKELVETGIQSGVPTGLTLVDNVTNGWQDSDLIILAGRPSMGKTAAAISMALYPALKQNIGVGIFSLEMSSAQLTSRMQSILSGVNVGRIVKKQLTLEEIEKVDILAKELQYAPIYLDDTPNISIQDFRAKARKMVKEFGCRMIIVDYLQLMRSGMKTHSREHEIAEISKALKAVAKDLEIPVIALSQLSRAVESRGGDKKPLLSDLRESGQIEQDADMVCFCYRPEYYDIDNYEVGNEHFNTDGLFMLLVSKHRNGELGEIPLRFIHEQTKLENYSNSNFVHFEEPKKILPEDSSFEKDGVFAGFKDDIKDERWITSDDNEDETPF